MATLSRPGHEQQTEMARELWQLQRRAMELAATLSAWQVEDSSLSRTLGDDGEFFEVNAGEFALKCRAVAARLDRTVAYTN